MRELLLAGRRKVREILLAPGEDGHLDGPLADLAELAEDLRVPVKVVGRSKLDAAARTEAPQGVVAFAAPLPEADLDDLIRPRLRTARPPSSSPSTVSPTPATSARSCAARSARGSRASCCPGTVPSTSRPRSPRRPPAPSSTCRSPSSAACRPPWSGSRRQGLWIVGLDGSGDTPLHALPFAADPVVLVLGAEGSGLSRLVRQRCDVVAAIPLRGRLSSLNVAAAGAIATYEVARARS